LEIFGAIMTLLCPLERDLNINFARQTRIGVIPTTKWKPAFERCIVLGKIRFEVYMTKKFFHNAASIINRDVDTCIRANHITG